MNSKALSVQQLEALDHEVLERCAMLDARFRVGAARGARIAYRPPVGLRADLFRAVARAWVDDSRQAAKLTEEDHDQ